MTSKDQLTTATGRVLGVQAVPSSSLWRITYADGKGGLIPEKYSGKYTSANYALEDAKRFALETHEVAAEHTKTKSKVA